MFKSATAPALVGQPPKQALSEIVAYMASGGFVVSQIGPASATFTRRKKPAWRFILLIEVVALLSVLALESSFLLLWWFVLAVVLVCYLLYFSVRPKATTGITALGSEKGTEIVLSGDDRKGKRDVERWVRENAI